MVLTCIFFASAGAWTPGSTPYIKGQVLVRFDHPTAGIEEANQVLDGARYEALRPLVRALDIYLVKLKGGLDVEYALADLEAVPELRWAQADHVLDLRQTFPDDPQFSSQWDMHNTGQSGGIPDADIDAPEAWDLGTGGSDPGGDDIVVAIVDGGMELTHGNLSPNLWVNAVEEGGSPGVDDDANGYVDDVNGWDAYSDDGSIPSNGHGTHVGGTVGARGNDNSQVCGVNWDVKLMAVAASSGTTSIISIGYGYVLDQKTLWISSGGASGANVVATNSSFGVDYADCTSGSYPVWNDLYNAMGAVGILSAAATANINIDIDVQGDVPTGCSSDWILAVTNTTRYDVKNSGAAYGATTIDLGAPGTDVLSTYTGNGTSTLTGTSMATPHVAGAVGFLHSVASPGYYAEYLADPGQAALTMKQFILDTVDSLPSLEGVTVSGGRLNLNAAALELSAYGGNLLSGTVTAEGSGDPIEDAQILAQPGGRQTSTDDTGYYALALQPGEYVVEYSAFGYQSQSLPVTIPEEGDVVRDVVLGQVESAALSGTLLDYGDQPVEGGEVEVLDTPLDPQVTGPDGTFSFLLPVGETFSVRSRSAPGVIHDPQDADAHGYRAYDPGDADWSLVQIAMVPGGVTQNLQGANRVVYDWSTIDPDQGGPGTAMNFTADDQTLQTSLPFDFTYYGQSFTTLSVCGNGWLAFGTTSSTEYRGQPIPDAGDPNAVLAPFWEDLSPQQTGSGNISTYYDAAGGRFIVEYYDIRQYSPSTDFERFQAILLDPAEHETVTGDGVIIFQYAVTGQTDNATVGIENPAGDDGLQYFYGRSDGLDVPGGTLPDTNPDVDDGLALLFTTGLLPDTPELEPVTDLSIAYNGVDVFLDWSASQGAVSYRVEVADALGGGWSTAGTTTETSFTYPVSVGSKIFRVIAMN